MSATQTHFGAPEGMAFVTTHWSVVIAAADKDLPGAGVALDRLCRIYWYPLYAFVRRRGRRHHEAEDLTQGFFERLADKDFLKGVTVEGGKFSSYLLTLFNRFLVNERNHD